ncbi:MAG: molybdate ABC transporter substrate-binding protein [Kofleriaceae bacterium]
MRFAPSLALTLLASCSSKPESQTVRVAAAADLARAFEEVGRAFAEKTHVTPIFTFDASGLLAQKIGAGAPYALFASAGKKYVDQVVERAHCDAASVKTYAHGQLVMWTAAGIAPPKSLDDLKDPRFARIAIANPDQAPYGAAAKEALQKAGVWGEVESRLKLGDNVQATLQFATTGAVDVAIVSRSLTASLGNGVATPIDPSLYAAPIQQLVVCATGDEGRYARDLADFIVSPDGKAILAKYGFTE